MALQMFDNFATVQFAFSVIVVSLLVLFTNRRYNTSISDIPGPFFASIGDFWHLYHVFKGHTEAATVELHEKHGKLLCVARGGKAS